MAYSFANLRKVHLKGANLDTAHLEGAKLYQADLERTNLRYAYLDRATHLESIDLDKAKIADVRWGDVNLSLVAWERVEILGDEFEANNQKKPKRNDPDREKKETHIPTGSMEENGFTNAHQTITLVEH